MKKIVFVEKDDCTSFDPVTTFFASKKPALPPKPSKPVEVSSKKIEQPPQQKPKADSLERKGNLPRKLPPKTKIKSQLKDKEEQVAVKIQRQEEKVEDKSCQRSVIRQLQGRLEEYQRRLTQYQQKQVKYIKAEHKLQKLQRQYKSILLRQKQQQQRQGTIKQLLGKSQIPYSKKRQVLLQNQILSLKKMNQQLVMRLKNYKGSDLAQMANNKTHGQIQRDYIVNEHPLPPLNTQLQSLLHELSQCLHSYIKGKCLHRTPDYPQLLSLITLSQRISLNCLSHHKILPLSEQPLFPQSPTLTPLVSRPELNMHLSTHNAKILSEVEQNREERMRLRRVMKGEEGNVVRAYEIRCNYTETLLVQAMCQMQAVQGQLSKLCGRVNHQLGKLGKVLEELAAVLEGGSKEGVYLFISSNIEDLKIKQKNINVCVKELMSGYSDVQSI